MACVYIHIRKDKDEIFYVGIGNSIKRAYKKSDRNRHWLSIINITEYDVEILFDNIDKKEALEYEVKLIRLIGRSDLNNGKLVNMTDGGDGHLSPSKETIEKIRSKNIGKKYSEDQRIKFGRKKELHHFWGKKRSQETKEKISKSMVGRKSNRKGVFCINKRSKVVLNHETGIFFDTISMAAFSVNEKKGIFLSKIRKKHNKYKMFEIFD